MLLDAAFLIDLMNGDHGAVEKARELERDLVQQWLSAMTLFELTTASDVRPSPKRNVSR